MSTANDGGPAFPISIPGVGDNGMGGMTLRDWFAGQVMAGLGTWNPGSVWPDHKAKAEFCYAAADAMLKAREF